MKTRNVKRSIIYYFSHHEFKNTLHDSYDIVSEALHYANILKPDLDAALITMKIVLIFILAKLHITSVSSFLGKYMSYVHHFL
jgi:hypothetical protein